MTPIVPQQNPYRQRHDLSGFWDFCFDRADSGVARGFPSGLARASAEGVRPIAVPASYNDQFEDGRDYLGPVWYERTFDLPWGWAERRVLLRFGSVNYHATVWLNGEMLGEHEGGHLPFVLDATRAVKSESNRLVVRAEGELRPDRVPPGNVPRNPTDSFANSQYPDGAFDFFPYAGIQRPVLLFTLPDEAIVNVTLRTTLSGESSTSRRRRRSACRRRTRSRDAARIRHGNDCRSVLANGAADARARRRERAALGARRAEPLRARGRARSERSDWSIA